VTVIGRKPWKTAHFQAFDPRAVFDVAVDNLSSAVDSRIEYHPHESPANRYIHGGAGDAVGTLRCLLRT
jgi:hypothetical protein